MPTSYKYILWSAFNSEGLFGLTQDLKKPKKNQKYLIFKDKEENENSVNSIWLTIKPDHMKQNFLNSLRPIFIELKDQIQAKVNNLNKAQEELLEKVFTFGNVLENQLMKEVFPKDIAKVMLWINSNKYEEAFGGISLFNMEEVNMDIKI